MTDTELVYVAERLEVAACRLAALHLTAPCGHSFLFQYSLQYLKRICCQKIPKMTD